MKGKPPVVFNFRMPQDHQRIMLFEKLAYMIEDSKFNKNLSTRDTIEQVMANLGDERLEKFISDIKRLYPIKLKGDY